MARALFVRLIFEGGIFMVVEFYGDISDYTKRRTDKLKRRYFAKWLALLTGVLVVGLLIALFANGGYLVFLIAAVVLGCVSAGLYFAPMRKTMEKFRWTFRVTAEGDFVTCTQYCEGGKTVVKKKRIDQIKRVIKTNYCYYLIYNDISNAFICERSLLKRGTFEYLESLFTGKIRVQNENFD